MLIIKLNREDKTPLFLQVVQQLITMINHTVLKPGERLPSSRKFARQLGVNRNTIYRAYEELYASGYIDSTPGAYSTVRKRPSIVFEKKLAKPPSLPQKQDRQTTGKPPEAPIDFRPLSPDNCLLPTEKLRKCINKVLIDRGESLLQYGEPAGYLPLREILANQLQKHNINISPGQLLITNGIQNGLDLLLKHLATPGTQIVVERPTYGRALQLFRLHNIDIIEVNMTPKGMDLNHLEILLKQHQPKMVYTMPNFHNPTGISTNQAHREKLLQLCEHHNTLLLEDGFEEELKYFGKAPLPLKSMDKKGIVIYLGTFSKVLFPGLRIGWLAANKNLIQAITHIKNICELSGNQLHQAAVAEFCKAGFFDLHLKKLHREYRKRMKTALRDMKLHLPKNMVTHTQPMGGYVIWLTMNHQIPEAPILMQKLVANGVYLTPGSHFFHTTNTLTTFRLSIAHTNETQITEGIKRIGHTLQQLSSFG